MLRVEGKGVVDLGVGSVFGSLGVGLLQCQ